MSLALHSEPSVLFFSLETSQRTEMAENTKSELFSVLEAEGSWGPRGPSSPSSKLLCHPRQGHGSTTTLFLLPLHAMGCRESVAILSPVCACVVITFRDVTIFNGTWENIQSLFHASDFSFTFPNEKGKCEQLFCAVGYNDWGWGQLHPPWPLYKYVRKR